MYNFKSKLISFQYQHKSEKKPDVFPFNKPKTGTNHTIQRKLKVSQPGDIYEQEADHVAEQVMNMPENTVQRKCSSCEIKDNDEMKIQRKSDSIRGLEVSENASSEISNIRSTGGSPLDGSTRDVMESRFGFYFGNVRIHADDRAARSAESVNARAYTVGNDIVFGRGQHNPTTKEGKKLLGHELVHVIQQKDVVMRDTLQRDVTDMVEIRWVHVVGKGHISGTFKISREEAKKKYGNMIDNLSRQREELLYRYIDLKKLHDDGIASRLSWLTGGAHMPNYNDIFHFVDQYRHEAIIAYNNENFSDTHNSLTRMSDSIFEGVHRLERTQAAAEKGAEWIVKGLEIIRETTFKILENIPGPAAKVALAVDRAGGEIAQQGVEVLLGDRKNIDWSGIATDELIEQAFGFVSEELEHVLGKKYPGKISKEVMKTIVRSAKYIIKEIVKFSVKEIRKNGVSGLTPKIIDELWKKEQFHKILEDAGLEKVGEGIAAGIKHHYKIQD